MSTTMLYEAGVALHASYVVNARFAGRRVTGVERVAIETLRHWPQVVRCVAPHPSVPRALGHLWEQTVLPLRIPGSALWSPCNFGPLVLREHVVTIHDAALFDHPEWFASSYATVASRLQAGLLRRASIVVPSEFTATRVRAIEPRSRVVVIPWATWLPLTDALERPASAPTGPFVLSVGSLQPRKDFSRLLRVWRDMGQTRDAVELVVVGGTDRLFSSTREVVEWRARHLGYVTDSELAWLYANCSAYVSLSRYEGFGLTPLEAAAWGTPVIASAIDVHRELLAETGATLVPLGDDKALADSLMSAIRGELPPTHIRHPRHWADVAADYHDLLTRVSA